MGRSCLPFAWDAGCGCEPSLGAAGTESRGQGAGASSPPWGYTPSPELQELGCIRPCTIPGCSSGIPAHLLGLKASGSSSFHLLPPAPSDGEGPGGCSSLVGLMCSRELCSPGYGSREQSRQRQAKGDVGKGAYGEEEEDNANSLFLREAAFRCFVMRDVGAATSPEPVRAGRACCLGANSAQH